MVDITIGDGHLFCTGVVRQVFVGIDITLAGDCPAVRTAFWIGYQAARGGCSSVPVFSFVCPKCGEVAWFRNATDIPIIDTPCEHGCDNVWAIRYHEWKLFPPIESMEGADGNPA